MPGRGRASFTKRQKEHARQEKRRAKAERKTQRKMEKQTGSNPLDSPDGFEENEGATGEAAPLDVLAEPGSREILE